MNPDKSIKRLVIPEGVFKISDEAYKNCKDLEEVIIPDSVSEIGNNAFAGCSSLKKIVLPKYLRILRAGAFTNCKNLEEVVFPENMPLMCFDKGLFAYCKSLKKINIPNNVNFILDYALFNCKSLESLEIPENVTRLGIMSLSGCGLKNISIPKNIFTIDLGAVSNLQNLESIEVSKENDRYLSEDGISLIDKQMNIFMQYALNHKSKEYTVNPYTEKNGSKQQLYGVGEFAFAGARHLEELTLFSSTDFLGSESFKNCNKLKKLNVKATPNCHTNIFIVMPLKYNSDTTAQFEEVNIEDGIEAISGTSYLKFRNLKTINLPSTLTQIDSKVFYSSKSVQELHLPKNIDKIGEKAFPPNILLVFNDGLSMLGKDLISLQTKGKYTIFTLRDGTYHIYNKSFGKIIITKDEIREFSNNSGLLENDPDKMIDYLLTILKVNIDSGVENPFFNQKFRTVLLPFLKNLNEFQQITRENAKIYLAELFKEKGYYNELILNGILMLKFDYKNAKTLIENYSELVETFLINLLSTPINSMSEKIIADVSLITDYCELLEKYNKKDPYLFNPIFILALRKDEQKTFIKEFDPHIKRLINASKILDKPDTSIVNMSDTFKLCKVLGVFEGNETLKQKVSNFIAEKVFADNLGNGDANKHQIVGDDIHRVFNLLRPRDEFDVEFSLFLIENYRELYELEKRKSGYIERIYNLFPKIYRTSTSNKGFQRHLKVTVEKCVNYLLENKFAGITPENKHIAEIIGEWFDDNDAFQNTLHIIEEAQSAPRNIFTKYKVVMEENLPAPVKLVFDDNPENDLREDISEDFSYEWLPKHELDNILLGKYCSCCAHVNGSGAGIMRASMISPDCQNLVVRNKIGKIISKATLNVNRIGKYGVFNTVETSLNYSTDPECVQKIYNAFMRGSNAFIESYNNNNPDNPLEVITLGQKRNTLVNVMQSMNTEHPTVNPYYAIDYADFQYNGYGTYSGDSKESQRLVLKKKMASK